MADDLGLNEHHQNTIGNYLRFAKYQRSQHLKTIESSFENVKVSRLLEETLTADEVKEILDELCHVLMGDLETELINTTHTVVLLLHQMCTQAEHWHLQLQADISELENSELLGKVSNFEKGIHLNFEKGTPGSPIRATKLEPLSEDSGPIKLLQMEIDRLGDENKRMVAKLSDMERQTVEVLEEKSALTEKLADVIRELQNHKDEEVDDIEKNLEQLESEMCKVKMDYEENLRENTYLKLTLEGELNNAKQSLLEVQSQLQLAEMELDKKFSQTNAFINMKQLLATKNEQIKTLRKKLSEYEETSE